MDSPPLGTTRAGSAIGFYDKGSQNTTFYDNNFTGDSFTGSAVTINDNPGYNRSSNGSTWYNTNLNHDAGKNSLSVSGTDVAPSVVTFINTSVNGAPCSPILDATASVYATLYSGWYYRAKVVSGSAMISGANVVVRNMTGMRMPFLRIALQTSSPLMVSSPSIISSTARSGCWVSIESSAVQPSSASIQLNPASSRAGRTNDLTRGLSSTSRTFARFTVMPQARLRQVISHSPSYANNDMLCIL